MTISCDKKGCEKTSKNNWCMKNLKLNGWATKIDEYNDELSLDLDLHFCFEHRKELAKIILKWVREKE